MKKLLNNPLVVGAMALIAVGIVVMNIIRPMMGSGKSPRPASVNSVVQKEEPQKSPEGKPAQSAMAEHQDEVADRGKINWRKKPALRDPFKPRAAVSRKSYSRSVPTRVVSFRLFGIWVEPGVRFAAINNKIVSEGDRIGEYRVAEIKPDSVLLKGPKGNRLLKFRNW